MADRNVDAPFVASVERYCECRGIRFDRTPRGAVTIWESRTRDAIDAQACFTLLCHPINLAVSNLLWGDSLDEFLLPVIDRLGALHRETCAWVCTCGQLTDQYEHKLGNAPKTPNEDKQYD